MYQYGDLFNHIYLLQYYGKDLTKKIDVWHATMAEISAEPVHNDTLGPYKVPMCCMV